MRANIQLHHGDCMEAMRGMPDNYYQLSLVDPPYGLGIDKDFGKSAGQVKGGKTGFCKAKRTKFHYSDWDKCAPTAEYFSEVMRVSKNQVVWGANHFGNMPPSPCWIVWDKKTNGYFADCELAWASFKTVVRKFEFTWNGLLQGDMKNKETRIHPTQKPVALYKWLLKNYAKEGDRILDTHGGSMSIAIACWDLKFDLDLWELDEDYYKAGVERLKNHQSQGQLF